MPGIFAPNVQAATYSAASRPASGPGFRRNAWRPLLRSLLLAVRAELLEIGPEVGDFLVVLDADERHAGAGHLLHRGADILDECVVVPGDAGVLVGRGIVESLVGAGLAAIDAVERRAELHLCVRSGVVTG